MQSLDSTFDELRSLLGQTDLLNPAKGDPFFYFVHAPAESLALKRRLRQWCSALEQTPSRWKPEVVSFVDLVWNTIGDGEPWDEWLEYEPLTDPDQVRRSVASYLTDNHRLVNAVKELVSQNKPNRLLLMTDAAVLHPWVRIRAIESCLHNQVRTPTVVFYPGRRAGQYGLKYLDVYTEDANYRSTLVGA